MKFCPDFMETMSELLNKTLEKLGLTMEDYQRFTQEDVDDHRKSAHARIEEECTGSNGVLDWRNANKQKKTWDERHGIKE